MRLPKLERLAIICRQPVQYYAPLFRMMAEKRDIMVFYKPSSKDTNFDEGFQRNIAWDIPLLDGYPYEYSHNLDRISAYRPTAILIYGWAYFSHLKVMMCFHKKVTILFRGDSTLLDPSSVLRRKIKTYLLKRVYRKVDFALYVGANNKAYFEQFGLKPMQLIHARHAVDNLRFGEDKHQEAVRIRTSLGITAKDTVLLYAGKLTPKKNPELLLRAFLELAIPNVHLLVVGDGILDNVLKKAARDQQTIHFMPFQNQQRMPAIYQSCDLFCIPSCGPGETWGLAINEAMASKRAILASTKVGAAADLIGPENGLVFESGNLDDLKCKLNRLLADKQNLEKLGTASHVKIQQWSFQHQINAIYGGH